MTKTYSAEVLANSVSPAGVRLTTLLVTMPRIVLAEFNTHRVFSRSSASSRAIPVHKRIQEVLDDPFVPEAFGRNKSGMQATEELEEEASERAEATWRAGALSACSIAQSLAGFEVHKQLANRVLEAFLWHTVIVTSTEWSNFFGLRISEHAQPEIRRPAEMMFNAIERSLPVTCANEYEWSHLPLVPDLQQLAEEGFSNADIAMISAGRCAAVSYLNHDKVRAPKDDLARAHKMVANGHMSPFEHVAKPAKVNTPMRQGFLRGWSNSFEGSNFRGWTQLRKTFQHEDDFSRIPRPQ